MLATLEVILAVLEELRGSNVECQGYVLAGLEAGLLDGVHDDVESSLGGVNGRCKATLVAQTSGQALVLQHCLQCVVDLGAHAKSLGERLRTNRSDHEFLDVYAGVSVCAAVEDVHHWHWQYVCIRAANVAVQRQCSGLCGGLGCGDGNAQDSVSAELGLVISTVQLNQCLVNEALIVGFEASNFVGNLLVDVLNGL